MERIEVYNRIKYCFLRSKCPFVRSVQFDNETDSDVALIRFEVTISDHKFNKNVIFGIHNEDAERVYFFINSNVSDKFGKTPGDLQDLKHVLSNLNKSKDSFGEFLLSPETIFTREYLSAENDNNYNRIVHEVVVGFKRSLLTDLEEGIKFISWLVGMLALEVWDSSEELIMLQLGKTNISRVKEQMAHKETIKRNWEDKMEYKVIKLLNNMRSSDSDLEQALNQYAKQGYRFKDSIVTNLNSMSNDYYSTVYIILEKGS